MDAASVIDAAFLGDVETGELRQPARLRGAVRVPWISGCAQAAVSVLLRRVRRHSVLVTVDPARQTGEVITVDVQTWASVASILAVGLAVLGTLSRKIDGVGVRIDKVETKIDGVGTRIDRVEAHLGARIDGLGTRIDGVGTRIDGVEAHLGARIDGLGIRIDGVKAHLEARIDKFEANLGARIDGLAAHMDAGFARVDTKLSTLEQRSFDLSMRLPSSTSAE